MSPRIRAARPFLLSAPTTASARPQAPSLLPSFRTTDSPPRCDGPMADAFPYTITLVRPPPLSHGVSKSMMLDAPRPTKNALTTTDHAVRPASQFISYISSRVGRQKRSVQTGHGNPFRTPPLFCPRRSGTGAAGRRVQMLRRTPRSPAASSGIPPAGRCPPPPPSFSVQRMLFLSRGDRTVSFSHRRHRRGGSCFQFFRFGC